MLPFQGAGMRGHFFSRGAAVLCPGLALKIEKKTEANIFLPEAVLTRIKVLVLFYPDVFHCLAYAGSNPH